MKSSIYSQAVKPTSFDYNPAIGFSNPWKKFIKWATAQEPNRFLWVAISLLGHGTIFTIATIITVMLTGNHFFLVVPTCLTMTLVLAINLAALPTKYTIPVFFLSLLVDILIVTTALGLS